jgi:ABC-type branched-subunit amino acid transport system substrate-binding protein
MRFRVTCLSVLLLAVFTVNSIAQPTTTTQADVALQRALDHYHAGKLNEAAGLLRGFIVSQPDPTLIDEAHYYLARIHLDLNNPPMALEYLDRISASPAKPASILLQGELDLQMGNAARVVDRLLEVETQNWTLPQRQERYLFLGEGLLALDEPQKALFFLQQAMVVEGEESPLDVLSRIYTLLSDRFNNSDLAEAAFMYQNSPVAYLAMLQLGWRALAAGQKELAQEWASAAMSAPIGFAYREEALALQAQLSDPTKLQRAVGVLLPLSGRYAAFGQRVQRGMELAMEDFRPHIPVRFIFRDTAGDETIAAQQLAELAISDRVMAVAGPLVGNAAQGAVRRANQERIPLLTMSQREGLAASSLYVFRNSLTPQLQVKALVDYAIETQGFTTFGIMNPQTRQGEHFAELFRDEIWRRGAEIVAEQSYETEQTDFRYQVRLLQGLDPNAPDEDDAENEAEEVDPDDPEAAIQEEEEEPPPFEALFIPDYADRISLIAPQIEFYGLKEVQLLGTNGWNDEGLPRLARQFVEGAVFADSFFLRSTYPFIQDFVAKFFNKYTEEPTILEAQGYDIAGILLTLLNDSRISSREDIRRALAQLQNFPGVTGATRFDLIGEADKVLYLLQVQNGTIVQIN